MIRTARHAPISNSRLRRIHVRAGPRGALAGSFLDAASSAQASELKPLYTQAVAEAQRAIDLAPTLPQGQLALGYARFAGFLDVRGARPCYEKAYRYGRGDADIVLLYAVYTARTRHFREARDAIDWALALDPLKPRTHRAAGAIAFASHRYADAIAQCRRALELNPKMANANATSGDSLMALGRLVTRGQRLSERSLPQCSGCADWQRWNIAPETRRGDPHYRNSSPKSATRQCTNRPK